MLRGNVGGTIQESVYQPACFRWWHQGYAPWQDWLPPPHTDSAEIKAKPAIEKQLSLKAHVHLSSMFCLSQPCPSLSRLRYLHHMHQKQCISRFIIQYLVACICVFNINLECSCFSPTQTGISVFGKCWCNKTPLTFILASVCVNICSLQEGFSSQYKSIGVQNSVEAGYLRLRSMIWKVWWPENCHQFCTKPKQGKRGGVTLHGEIVFTPWVMEISWLESSKS